MYEKQIVYSRETRDYAMYLSGELVGFARTYHEAEITLDQTVYELMVGGHFNTATELDGGAVEMLGSEQAAFLLGELDKAYERLTGGMVVVQIATEAPESLREDCLNVVTMALGSTHGAASVVSELRRLKARLEQVQGRAVTQG